jgi:hypothetical protein
MTSKTRLSPAEITGIYGAIAKRLTKKRVGQAPDSLGVMWHNRRVLQTFFGFFGKPEKGFSAACGLQPLATPAAGLASSA